MENEELLEGQKISINSVVKNLYPEPQKPELNGEEFNPEIHAVDHEGNPVKTQSKRFAKKRGWGSLKARNKRLNPEKEKEENVSSETEQSKTQYSEDQGNTQEIPKPETETIEPEIVDPREEQAKQEQEKEAQEQAQFNSQQSAEQRFKTAMIATMGFQFLNVHAFGEEFLFQKFEFQHPDLPDPVVMDEKEMCMETISGIMEHYNLSGNLHPVLYGAGFLGMFYGSRWKHKKARDKMSSFMGKTKLVFGFFRMKLKDLFGKRESKVEDNEE